MAATQLDLIVNQVQTLSVSEQLQLVKRILELLEGVMLQPPVGRGAGGLVYGKYKDAPGPMATEEEFRLAEWRPTEAELNGP